MNFAQCQGVRIFQHLIQNGTGNHLEYDKKKSWRWATLLRILSDAVPLSFHYFLQPDCLLISQSAISHVYFYLSLYIYSTVSKYVLIFLWTLISLIVSVYQYTSLFYLQYNYYSPSLMQCAKYSL